MPSADESIAVIGIGCRFPGSCSTPSKFWDLLRKPEDVGSQIRPERFSAETFYHPDGAYHGTTNARKAYLLSEDVAGFDAPFFKISSKEAEAIDPQQRLVLETVYESIEAAGLRLDDLMGTDTGIFCGVMCDDYQGIQQRDISDIPHYTATGTARSIISNRVSYFFDWHGPSMTIDTACSSSLVAVHLATKALQDSSCRVAVSSGTNLILAPNMFVTGSKLGMLSPQGRSRMWDAGADGYARGEGVAAIVLKKLSDAVADGDSIDCIIRATNINQDGRSMGITMPSSAAQTSLIQSTYRKAGLDPVHHREDRCQYFEAHGTGTPAGDPQEASAIHAAFFSDPESKDDGDLLYVGSVKTVIGHTEGTAGLAALIKAVQSIQHGVIAPNLHFERLNPAIEPYYRHLRIPTECQPWPELPTGVPRRVSVNSFGFGGTNAHAILESHAQARTEDSAFESLNCSEIIPFVFSAPSEKALGSVLATYVEYMSTNPCVNLSNLAWTLFRRRTAFHHRVALYATSVESLVDALREEITRRGTDKGPSTTVPKQIAGHRPMILGVFTGQGAQWPQMGLQLVNSSPLAAQWLENLQASLDQLPAEYRPRYSLREELAAPQEMSKLHLAEISQPLCTAVQIILVNFLRHLNFSFSAVVGHSSGEIAAAYAAGILSADEAIRIAHLRGHTTSLAGSDGKKGAMMAAGMSADEAEELCQSTTYRGRIKIAAVNSSSSVTLSGDADSIKLLEDQLKDEGIFARVLKVNIAYHSHHMLPCSEPYLRAMEACQIKPQEPVQTKWFSSVYRGQKVGAGHLDVLSGQYWADNMTRTVLFSDAVSGAMEDCPYDMIVEVGPHPALKAPVLSTVSEGPSQDPPNMAYTSLLNRSMPCKESFARAIGEVYGRLGPDYADIEAFSRCFHEKQEFTLVKGLPCYPFDRSNSYWAESRVSRASYRDAGRPNQLLGNLSPDSTDQAYRWRNFLRASEIPWLSGHCIQSQPVFPATGYVAMALEAAHIIAGERQLQLFEVQELVIKSAISLDDDEKGSETLFEVDQLAEQNGQLSAGFACFSTVAGKLQLCASGRLSVLFGEENDPRLLPARQPPSQAMSDVEAENFYSFLESLGYGYVGLFKGIASLRWKQNMSDGRLLNASQLDSSSPLKLHPALMDLLLQGMLAAVGKPGNEKLYTLHIPVSIGRVLINPAFCGSSTQELGHELPFEAVLTSVGRGGAIGDASLFDDSGNRILQMERIRVTPLMQATPGDDRQLFFGVEWGRLLPDLSSSPVYMTSGEAERSTGAERLALVYMRNVQASLTADDRANLDWHGGRVVDWIDHVLSQVHQGNHPVCPREWLTVSWEEAYTELARTCNPVEVKLMQTVGQNLLRFLRHETTILEELRQSGLLDAIYKETEELAHFNQRVADVVSQLALRFPRMKILEIGAGSGSATKAVLSRLGRSLYSYTFTDISAGFLDQAEADFAAHADLLTYRVLDIEKDPQEQGFQPNSFDLVIAANVLHATRDLQRTLSNTRQLLKPGGHLVLLEGSNPNLLRTSFTMAGFEGWWLGEHDGRRWGAMTTPTRWHTLLQETGFSGIDTITPGYDDGLTGISVFASQAVDDHLLLLRDPLSAATAAGITSPSNELVIVGGASLVSSKLAGALQAVLRPHFQKIIHVKSLQAPIPESLRAGTLLYLGDLDCPFFQDLSPQSLKGMQQLVKDARNLLWVSAGADADKPHQSMSQALLRCLMYESSHTRFQHLNLEDESAVEPRMIAETLLRLVLAEFDNDCRLPRTTETIEPELRLVNGTMYIPRITPDEHMNERNMSQRRLIYREANPEHANISVSLQDGVYEPLLIPMPHSAESSKQKTVCVRVAASTLTALRVVGMGYRYLSVGHDMHTKQPVVALARDNASVIATPAACVVPCCDFGSDATKFLAGLAWTVVGIDLVARTAPHSSIVVHDAGMSLRAAIRRMASHRSVTPRFTTTDEDVIASDDQISRIHPFASIRTLTEIVPDDVSLVATFDATNGQLFNGLPVLVHGRALHESMETIHSTHPRLRPMSEVPNEASVLQLALKFSIGIEATSEEVSVLDMHSVGKCCASLSRLQFLDWQTGSRAHPIPVSVQPAGNLVQLSAHKTYLLVGMTGDLGMSVCEWMISKGARNVVLTSRKPQTDQGRIDAMMSEAGARVVTMSMDVTSRDSIQQVDRRIRETLPPVGGVVNGAMVLEDQLFTSMSFEAMDRILKPKVQGSILLDELYTSHDLDFFICFGSLTGPAGNTGQSAYSAATSFMASLVEGRRKRGLAGSIICPGEIRGVGYVARSDQRLVALLRDAIGDTSIGEGELNELFAEAILAGHPDSGHQTAAAGAAPIAGFPTVDPDEQPHIVWLKSPRTWRQLRYSAAKSVQETTSSTVSVRQQLAAVSSADDARRIIQEALIAKIRKKLKIPEDVDLSEDNSPIELGMDSLVAVDLRTWFVKELAVDMPVIKLLNSSSIAELIDHAVAKLPPDLLATAPTISSMQKDQGNAEKPLTIPKKETTQCVQPPIDRTNSKTSIDTQATSPSSAESNPLNQDIPTPLTSESCVTTPGSDKSFTPPKFDRVERLSYPQSRFWYLQQLHPDKTYSNVTMMLRLDRAPIVEQFEAAVDQLARRHEILRTCYRKDGDGPYQAVLEHPTFHLEVVQVQSEAEARDLYHSRRQHVYDLENGDNFRICLAITTDSQHFVIVGFHHICLDGLSFHMLLNELESAYLKRSLPPMQRQYADYAAAQRSAYSSGELAGDVAYWQQEFDGSFPNPVPLFPMSRVRTRQVLADHPTENVRIEVPASIMAAVRAVGKRLRVTPANFFMAVLRIFVARLTGSTDFCIGMSILHRVADEDHSLIGLLMNLLPIRFLRTLEDHRSFQDILMHTKKKVSGAVTHSGLQFDRLLDELAVPRSATHSPLFQVMLDWQPQNTEKRGIGNIRADVVEWAMNKTAFDMVLQVTDSGDETTVMNFRLQQALFTKDASDLVARSFTSLLESFALGDVHQKAIQPPLYPPTELQLAHQLGRGPTMSSQWPSTVSRRIDDVARAFADRVAVKEVGNSHGLTYKVLDQYSRIIAVHLAEKGVQPGSKVCFFQQPSERWIACMLGVWRLGATYVPLDVRSPPERTALIIQDCQPQVILCDSETQAVVSRMGSIGARTLNTADVDMTLPPGDLQLDNRSTPDACSVILYSSGTTGRPKGFQLSHANLQNQLEGFTTNCQLNAPTILQQGAMTFDISLEQILTGLTTGGRVIVASGTVRLDPSAVASAIVSEDITCTMATPSEYLLWIQYASGTLKDATSWQMAFSGGESFPHRLCDAFRELELPNLRLFNFYGPGETTIASHQMEIEYKGTNPSSAGRDIIPVGHALPNYETYIVDQHLNPVPQGISGEIVIAGPSVCAGYVNLDELNQAKFVPNPGLGDGRAYRTTERGHLRPDGALVLEGRLEGDTQVKLRGIRIDLCDVETEILRAADGALTRVIVSLRDNNSGGGDSDPFLAAHAEFQPDFTGDKDDLLRAVRASMALPQYMRPSIIVPVDQMPRTAHGKLDRRVMGSLPLPERKRSSVMLASTTSATNSWVSRVAGLWQEALEGTWTDCPDLELDTDFFLAGGNSILLVKLQTLLFQQCGVSVPLITLVEGSTLLEMADAVATSASHQATSTEAAEMVLSREKLALSS